MYCDPVTFCLLLPRLMKMDHFLEDEVLGVEHLLAEPKCSYLGDDVLGFKTFSQQTFSNFEEFSTLEYGSIKTDCGNNLVSLYLHV